MKNLVLVAACCLTFAVLVTVFDSVSAQVIFGPGPSGAEAGNGGGDSLDTIVAVVEDDVITRSELDSTLTTVQRQLAQRGTALPPPDVLEKQVLERLIMNRLQERAAEQNGVTVEDQTVNAAMEQLARQNGINLNQLRQAVELDGYSYASFRAEMRRELLITRLRQRLVDSRIQIGEQEVDNFLATNAGAVGGDVEYHLAQIIIAVPETASSEQVQAASEKALQVLEQLRQGADFGQMAAAVSNDRRALEGGDLGWRKASQIPSMFADAIQRLSPGDISEPLRSPGGFHLIKLLEVRGAGGGMVTQTHARHILIQVNELISDEEARQRLERLRERILNGEDFADLARANSNDTASAVQGGDLSWLSPGDVTPQFEQEMDRLQPGEISEPFKTRFGWHIVQVVERRQHDNTTEAQRAAAREALFKRKVEEEWEQLLRRLRDEAYVDVRL